MVAGGAFSIVSFLPDVAENAGEVWQGMGDGGARAGWGGSGVLMERGMQGWARETTKN